MSIKPSESSYYSLKCISISHSIYALPQDVDVMDCFDRPVKTSCGFVHMARKTEITRWKLFFSV